MGQPVVRTGCGSRKTEAGPSSTPIAYRELRSGMALGSPQRRAVDPDFAVRTRSPKRAPLGMTRRFRAVKYLHLDLHLIYAFGHLE